ncbi:MULTISPECIES: hypothetical protein [unclassified Stenotrophomonas]|uniref:hypothetical protein n=1 Tax=unclassified Stenotrophomonas TaxID=196198 RepID=UPI000D16754C|nr:MULTISPECIES: hypothetical protein [unclassified Stenotrophomonas]PTA72780.1 hypothetical protein C9412_04865 [Stenotrophomonas sp. Nf1]PTA82395.1 hypothetical protein C9416_04195 [Stenotrophomonas sp. Nf4]
MVWFRWATTVLSLAVVVAVRLRWPSPPVPEQLVFQLISDDRFSQLRRQAMQFVEERPRQGFQFVDTPKGAPLQIHCRGVPVLWLERRPQHLLMQVSLDAEQRAPDVLPLRAFLRWQMEPLGALEQMSAGVPEPVLMDRVMQWMAGGVPGDARCGGEL